MNLDWEYPSDAVQAPYGDERSYRLGANFLRGLAVEDWGCGLGWYRRYHEGPYIGIDGSPSPFADVVRDLASWRSVTPALFMRHVLEHNMGGWRLILENALASFQKRMVLVLFTWLSERDTVLTPGVVRIPDVSLCRGDLLGMLRGAGCTMREEGIASKTRYGAETLYYLERA